MRQSKYVVTQFCFYDRTGIQKMLETYEITPDQAIYFGDDNDDVEPIRRCGCGVAVSNALERVRDVADYITESNDKDGVARFLVELVSGNRAE